MSGMNLVTVRSFRLCLTNSLVHCQNLRKALRSYCNEVAAMLQGAVYKKKRRLNCRTPHHLFASHWITIASIVIQSTPTHVMAGPGYSAIAPKRTGTSEGFRLRRQNLRSAHTMGLVPATSPCDLLHRVNWQLVPVTSRRDQSYRVNCFKI